MKHIAILFILYALWLAMPAPSPSATVPRATDTPYVEMPIPTIEVTPYVETPIPTQAYPAPSEPTAYPAPGRGQDRPHIADGLETIWHEVTGR